RGCDERGFAFFTNYDSRKGRELAENPRAALVFFWPELERQVRVEGRVTKGDEAEAEGYFRGRAAGGRVGGGGAGGGAPGGGRGWSGRWPLCGPVIPTRTTSPGRRIGGVIGSSRTSSSSGRGGRADCTTASGIGGRTGAG